ncbi:MAG: glycosyltransferase [Pseudonocardiaceae bacterium]|nr:glycosyltransferase [Pseudonocardiaceae bacterium]
MGERGALQCFIAGRNVNDDQMVVAVCCGRLQDLRQRWEHNIAQLYGEAFFVLLDCAHSAEADALADTIRSAGGLVRFHGERRGLSAARNSVLAAWPVSNIVFVDDDTELNREAITAARAAFSDGAHVVGARLVPPELPVRWSWHFTPGQMHLVGWHPPGEAPRTWGAFMGIDARFAHRNGLRFDARLGRTGRRLESGDDTSFVAAMKAAGARETILATAVVHNVDPERFRVRYLARRAYWQGRSEIRRAQPVAGLRKEWARQTVPGAGLLAARLYTTAFITGVIHEIADRNGCDKRRVPMRSTS